MDTVFSVGNTVAGLYQTYINDNPDNYAEFSGEAGGFRFRIRLDGEKSELMAGNSVISAALTYDGATEERTGRVQLTDGTAAFVAAKFGKTAYDVFDPDTNIAFGCYYLWYLSKKFADPATALAAYNAGEGNVAMWLKDDRYSADGKTLFSIPYRETKNHVRKTLRYREKYQKIYKM